MKDFFKRLMALKMQEATAVLMLAVGVGFATMGFWTHPVGSIHDSVLWIFAQCLIYTGSVLGVESYVKRKIEEKLENRF